MQHNLSTIVSLTTVAAVMQNVKIVTVMHCLVMLVLVLMLEYHCLLGGHQLFVVGLSVSCSVCVKLYSVGGFLQFQQKILLNLGQWQFN